jgi:hypothetical protein
MTHPMTRARVSLHLPLSVKAAAERFAAEDGVSLNHFIAVAVAEKVGAAGAAAFFAGRGAQGDPGRAAALLRAVPDAPPLPGDEV